MTQKSPKKMKPQLKAVEQDPDLGHEFQDMIAPLFGEDATNEPSYHTILEVWRAVLAPAREERSTVISPAWAMKVVQTYPEVTFADMLGYQERYFDLLVQLLEIVEAEIDEDAECLSYTSPAEDVANNSEHYFQVLLTWQQAILQCELEWRPDAPDAGVQIAVMNEVQKMIFGPTGISSYLDNVGFQFSDQDSTVMADILAEQRDTYLAKRAEEEK